MKRQIRSSVFETNSSSTHSIAIPNDCDISSNMSFRTDEFGWSFDEAYAPDYFYTAIYETSETEAEANEKIEHLKNILDKNGIFYHFRKPKTHISTYDNKDYFYLDNGYIDHGFELKDFVNELMNDEAKLLRFLSGGLIFTGNDNSDNDGFISRNEEFIEHYNWRTNTCYREKNPYYMSNHADYEWYYKGN